MEKAGKVGEAGGSLERSGGRWGRNNKAKEDWRESGRVGEIGEVWKEVGLGLTESIVERKDRTEGADSGWGSLERSSWRQEKREEKDYGWIIMEWICVGFDPDPDST